MSSLRIKAAFSPCPNDVFLFYPWKEHKVTASISLKLDTFDIDTLNTLALTHTYPLIKISAALYPQVSDYYEILPVGVTLGYDCGPLLITSEYNAAKTVTHLASPGKHTTAHALFKRYFSSDTCTFLNYKNILPSLQNNVVDGALLIHETRFHLPSDIYIMADLGKLWFKETSLPVPLGCLVIARHLPITVKKTVISILRECYSYSYTFFEQTLAFATLFSQEKDLDIIKQFLNTYISSSTYEISLQGEQALNYFWAHSQDPHGLLSE